MIYALAENEAELNAIRQGWPDPFPNPIETGPEDWVRVHLVGACDRPRNHSFHIHRQTWPMDEHLTDPRIGAIDGITTGSLRTVRFTTGEPGDYAYRTGVLRWALFEGLWGIIRVQR